MYTNLVETFHCGAHHKRVGLADKVRRAVCSVLDGRDQRLAGGHFALVGGCRKVCVCTDKFRAFVYKHCCLFDTFKVVIFRFADYHVLGVNVVDGNAHVIQRIGKSRVTYYICRACALALQKTCRGKRSRIEIFRGHVQAHTLQFLLQFLGRLLTVVGQKQKPFVVFLQPAYKFLNAVKQCVAVIDYTVHIAYKAEFATKFFHYFLLKDKSFAPHL